MKKYLKLIIALVVFFILFAGARVLYNNLSKQYGTEQLQTTDTTGQTDAIAQNEEAQDKEEQNEEAKDETTTNPTVQEFDFTVTDADGTERTLSSFAGKPIVVNFWASWCSVCKQEFPDFQSAYETYGSEVEFVMVNMTDGFRETESKAKSFIDENGYTFPIYYDLEQNAASVYGIRSLPTTYFIDAEGTIITYAQGMLTEESLQQGLDMIRPSEP